MGKKIKEIIINSFRGYKDKTIFNFTKDNLPVDLVVLHAPNGFGKTSFFEAVEWCLSGKLSRLENNRILKDAEDKDRGYTLSNRYSDNLGAVTIIDNESKKLKRQMKQSRSTSRGMRDYGYDILEEKELESLTKIDITSHLLTQDGMDSFLRFTSSEEKFKALSSFWKNGIETSERYRQLNILHSKVKIKKQSLNTNIAKIKKDIESVKITQEQVDDVNKKLIEINNDLHKDENINFIFNVESNIKEIIELDNKLKILKANIDNEILNLNTKKERLENLKKYFPNYKKNKHRFIEVEKKIESNKKLLDKYKELKYLEKELKVIKSEIEKSNVLKSKLLKVKSLYESYKKIEKELEVLQKSLIEVSTRKSKLVEDSLKIDNKLYELRIQLKLLVDKKENIEKIQKDIELVLVHLKNTNNEIIEINTNLVDEKKKFELVNNKHFELFNKKARYELDKNFANEFYIEEYKISDKYISKCNELKEVFLKRNICKEAINKIDEKKKKTLELKDDITKLISIGKNLVEDTNSSVCPLCNHDYESHDSLFNKITGSSNDILEIDSIQKNLDLKNEEYNKLDIEYQTKLNSLSQLINEDYSKFMVEYVDIQQEYEKVKNTVIEFENKLLTLTTKLSQFYTDLQRLYKLEFSENTFTTIYENYNSLISVTLENEKSAIDKNIVQFKVQQTELSKEKDSITIKSNQEEQTLENLTNKRNTLEEEPTFVEFRKLIVELNISIENFQNEINQRIDINKELLTSLNVKDLEFSNKIKSIAEELNIYEFGIEILKIKDEDDKKELILLKENIEKIEKEFLFFKFSNDLKEENIDTLINKIITEISSYNILKTKVVVLNDTVQDFINDLDIDEKEKEILSLKEQLKLENKFLGNIKFAIEKYKKFIEDTVSQCFNTKTINEIYNRIDPHPTHKEVKFIAELEHGTRLRVKTSDSIDDENDNDPTLYNSSGQISILSLSIFLVNFLTEN